MNYFIEIMLALFWTSYLLLHWQLMRAPVNEDNGSEIPLQGELQCTPQAMK